MKKLWVLVVLVAILAFSAIGCGSGTDGASAGSGGETAAAETPGTVTITDMAGRTVEIPAEIDSVYSSSPVGTNLIYTFRDTLVAGTNYELAPEEMKYTTEYYQNLPNLGGWYGQGNQGNVEEIIKAAPDIVLSTGLDQSSIDSADQLQQQLGIPVVLADSDDMAALADTYRFLGEILGDAERAEELATYVEETLAHAAELSAKVADEDRITVYYAEEQDGLHTDPSGSMHSRLIEVCGGVNVADCEITPGYGRTAVSIEQVIAWDPELIIACIDNGYADSSSYNTILTDAKWAGIQAVKDGLVFQTPTEPQNWFDRPPSVNTLIGVKWVQAIFYPDVIDYDMADETKTFYKLFYQVDLTDDEVSSLLDKALRAA